MIIPMTDSPMLGVYYRTPEERLVIGGNEV